MAKHKEPFLDLKPRTEDEKGKYVLMIFRPVPFGYGVMVFFIDNLKDGMDKHGHVIYREAYQGKNLVTRFPSSFDYLLTARDQFEFREPEPEEEAKAEEPDPDRIGPISHL